MPEGFEAEAFEGTANRVIRKYLLHVSIIADIQSHQAHREAAVID